MSENPPARRGAVLRGIALLVLLGTGTVLVLTVGAPDVDQVRSWVDGAGALAPAVFVLAYAMCSMLPAPKALVTVLAGVLWGLLPGALLAWTGAMIGAIAAFLVARGLGRDLVDRLLRGQVRRVDDVLRDRGLLAVLIVRLVPVLPFTAINYGAGVTGVRTRDYVVGSLLGIIPGTLAYAAIGAFGLTRPWLMWVAVGMLVLLVVVGGRMARRHLGVEKEPAPPASAAGTSRPEGDDA